MLKSFSFNNFAIKYNATFTIEFPYQNIVENSDVIRRIFFHRHLIDTKFAENKNNNYLVWDSEQTKQDHNSFTQFSNFLDEYHGFNLFHATDLFWYPLKTSENQMFLMFSGGIKRDQWHEMGYRLIIPDMHIN